LRIETGCLRPTPADNLSILAGIQPADLRRNGSTLFLVRRATELGHLLHSALIRLSSADARRFKSRHLFVPAAHLISLSDNNNTRAAQWADNPTRLRIFIPAPTLPRRTWVRLNRLRTDVGRFLSCLASSVACECGAEQTVDHVVLQCPIHRSPHGLHGLTILDDETTEWLLNTCPEIWCGQAVV